ncbi:MAG: protease modulator HflC, partial [Candidatus Electrothrix sp. AX2]|nr:protease modulator HflC [Candidatus Electrothrix gigas]
MKQLIQIVTLALVVAFILSLWDGFYILREGQQAVITQFGAP